VLTLREHAEQSEGVKLPETSQSNGHLAARASFLYKKIRKQEEDRHSQKSAASQSFVNGNKPQQLDTSEAKN
jgi:hypothetical protein